MTTVGGPDGRIGLPGDPEYRRATQVFNLAAPPQPAAAVTVGTVDQIRAALEYARAQGLGIRVHTTGHASAAVRPMEQALLIRTRMAGGVEIDPLRRVARVPAGARWGAIATATAPYGLVAAHGSAPTVGAVGYLLRGGLSFYGRRFGLAVNTVRAVDLVTADGEERRVDSSSDPELFWALRGGGGGFGVVTSIDINLFPASSVITGVACWPARHAGRLIRRWQRWTQYAPPEVTTSVRVMNLPATSDAPPALASGPLFCVDGAVLAATPDDLGTARRYAGDLLDPLRAVAEPVLDTWAETAPSAVLRAHMDPTDPLPIIGDHMLLSELGEDGMAQFLRVTGEDSGSPLVLAGLRQLGGAYAVAPPDAGALGHLDARYSYAGSAAPLGPVTAESIRAHCDVVRAALAAWDTGRTVPSFVERAGAPQRHLDPDQVLAADRIRRRVDPAGLFAGDVAPQTSIPR